MKISVSQYYKGFISFYGLIASIPLVDPVVRLCVSDSNALAGYLFPPLGDAQHLLLPFTVVMLLTVTYVIFVYCQGLRKVPRKAILALLGGMVLGSVALMLLYNSFVLRVEIPSVDAEVYVSIGYQRTDFAVQTYPEEKWTDSDMLRDRGPWEEQIKKLWTRRSISIVRVLLWLFYAMSLACLISIMSLAVYQQELEKPLSPVGHTVSGRSVH
jgi:hypothetical protein